MVQEADFWTERSVYFDKGSSGLAYCVYLTRTYNCPLIESGDGSPSLGFQNNVTKHIDNEAQSLISSPRLHQPLCVGLEAVGPWLSHWGSTSLTAGLIGPSVPPPRHKEKKKHPFALIPVLVRKPSSALDEGTSSSGGEGRVPSHSGVWARGWTALGMWVLSSSPMGGGRVTPGTLPLSDSPNSHL